MVLSVDMTRIKRESYRIIRRDGLSDICSGLMLGMMALFFFDFKYAGALIVGCAMQTIILPTCRRSITYPRVGYVKFRGRSDVKDMIMWDIALPLIVVGLVVCVGVWARQLLPACMGLLLAGLALAGARVTEHVLDYTLLGLFLVSGIVAQLLVWRGYDPAITTAFQLWGLSVILIPAGLVQFILFLRKNPSHVTEAQNVNL
jgi:hypothetical protein